MSALRSVLFTLCAGSALVGCGTSAPDLDEARRALVAADSAWAAAAAARDLEASVNAMADDGIMFPPDQAPVVGRKAIKEYMAAAFAIPGFSVEWVTGETRVSSSGDLAYSLDRSRHRELGDCDRLRERHAQSHGGWTAMANESSDLCFMSARELQSLVRTRKLSAHELMAAHLQQINRVNPKINAIVAKLDDDKCLALADDADRRLARAEMVGPLHGLPIAFKDFEAAIGLPFTRGSLIYKDYMPTEDTVLVERLRKAGVVPIGKTNVPEFAMGSHTYNKVYGTTVNPYDLTKSAGGSSGGAGAALAAGLLPVADGSDLGGSLRNPANFNNIVALRPTVGLVPLAPTPFPLIGFMVKGPMARSVADAAFLLSVMAGPDPRDPGCYPSEPSAFAKPLDRSLEGVRVAWCPDLGGLPLDRRVRGVLETQRKTFTDLGCIVEEACPDLSGANQVFLDIRTWMSWNVLGPLLEKHRDQMKPEAVWQIEAGAKLSGTDVARAMIQHGELMERMRRFQEKYEFMLCAANQVPPFDATIDWPKEIEGVKMENYVAWMKSAYWITATFRPAISVPAGFTSEGLPVGIQIVGRYRDDLGVLQIAHAFEQATGFGRKRPAIALS